MLATRRVGNVRVHAVAFYIVVVLCIFAYGWIIRRAGAPDVLENALIDDPAVQNCDGWAATHFIFWGFLGFWFPGRHVQALFTSLAWEGFEDFLGRTDLKIAGKRVQLVGGTDDDTKAPAGDDEKMRWYGRYTTDTAYNLMGYILGSALARGCWPEEAAAPC